VTSSPPQNAPGPLSAPWRALSLVEREARAEQKRRLEWRIWEHGLDEGWEASIAPGWEEGPGP
jgi:hypothetical protein